MELKFEFILVQKKNEIHAYWDTLQKAYGKQSLWKKKLDMHSKVFLHPNKHLLINFFQQAFKKYLGTFHSWAVADWYKLIMGI